MESKMPDARWKVGPTQSVTFGPSHRYGFGFTVQDWRGAPTLAVSLETEQQAKEAEAATQKIIEAAIDVTSHGMI